MNTVNDRRFTRGGQRQFAGKWIAAEVNLLKSMSSKAARARNAATEAIAIVPSRPLSVSLQSNTRKQLENANDDDEDYMPSVPNDARSTTTPTAKSVSSTTSAKARKAPLPVTTAPRAAKAAFATSRQRTGGDAKETDLFQPSPPAANAYAFPAAHDAIDEGARAQVQANAKPKAPLPTLASTSSTSRANTQTSRLPRPMGQTVPPALANKRPLAVTATTTTADTTPWMDRRNAVAKMPLKPPATLDDVFGECAALTSLVRADSHCVAQRSVRWRLKCMSTECASTQRASSTFSWTLLC
jgi:hypothetical protein